MVCYPKAPEDQQNYMASVMFTVDAFSVAKDSWPIVWKDCKNWPNICAKVAQRSWIRG